MSTDDAEARGTRFDFDFEDEVSGKGAPVCNVPGTATIGEILKFLEEAGGFGPFSILGERSALLIDGKLHSWNQDLEMSTIVDLEFKEDGSTLMYIWKEIPCTLGIFCTSRGDEK
jgi:hypothetical protein